MPLKAVLIDREKLIAHGSWNEPLKELLLGLYQYETAVIDIGRMQPLDIEIPYADSLVIADCEDTVQQAKEWNTAILGYQPPMIQETDENEAVENEAVENEADENGAVENEAVKKKEEAIITSQLDMIVEGFEEVDFYFLERMYQRFHHLPWTVIETERCYLREETLEDLDDLYELYRPVEITRYLDGLYEDRQKEEEYTKAYIENMYRFYGYGLWLVMEKATGKLIGRAGLSLLEVEEEVCLEMGYLIGIERQNQGYATEVCEGIIKYAKEALEADKIYCLIQQENTISVHLAEKLGFIWDKSVISGGKEMQRYLKILQT